MDGSIKDLESKIDHADKTLKHLGKLQQQISSKTVERSTLFKEQERQYNALAEENEGKCLPQHNVFVSI